MGVYSWLHVLAGWIGILFRFGSLAIAFSAEPSFEVPLGMYHLIPLVLAVLFVVWSSHESSDIRTSSISACSWHRLSVLMAIPTQSGSFAYDSALGQLTNLVGSATLAHHDCT